ncbi:leucine-rich repeat-containing protein (substrate of the Dot/Icm secretion system) [Legionella feeleii]|uniref:Leucine-rich repeat-containing protein (Substrate of the Dot/Icm secretion system) n=2 Tax=Legionella feeleii TaxID=453 RepID=A0A378IPW3_9GAMM|nr:leucine-rich repeat-containing protein (substrate of the Dot/Icm secretion system) [Legionella feeleii]
MSLLYEYSQRDLIMSGLPTLKLNDSKVNLAKSIKTLSTDTTRLDLSENYLGLKNIDKVTQVLKTILPWVTTLSLASNHLNYLNGDHLIEILSSIPKTITTLDLSYNLLDILPGNVLKRAFAAMPDGLSELILSRQSFGLSEADELAEAFTGLSPNIITMDLTETLLGGLSLKSLLKLKNSLPHLRKIYLSYDEVSNMSEQKLAALFDIFPNVARENIIFIKDGVALNDSNDLNLDLANFLRKQEIKSVVPSLLNQCAFFIKRDAMNHDTSSLPAELQEKVNSF